MRLRLGRTLRLVFALGFLVLIIPFLMYKLESDSKKAVVEPMGIDYPEVSRLIM